MINYIELYYSDIKNGSIKVSRKIERTYRHIVEDIIHNNDSEYYYDSERADRVIKFIEDYCKHSKGKMGGKPFLLELWQKAMIASAFGIVHKITELRKYQRVMLVVGRKNGKSTLSAAIALYLMTKDNEPGAEIYSVATKKDQAKIIWLEAKRMVNKSKALKKRVKPLVSELRYDAADATYRPIGRDSETLDGLNVHGAAMDEVHAWTDMNMYDVIVDGIASREQPMILITTTAGTVRESVYDRLYEEAEMTITAYDLEEAYDEHSLFLIYELDTESEWQDPTNWIKANPGLGSIKKIATLEEKVEKAKKNARLISNLLCKDFNRRQNAGEAFFTYEETVNPSTVSFIKETKEYAIKLYEQVESMWRVRNEYRIKPRYGIFGVDLSSTTDLTAASVIWKVPNDEHIYVKSMYWLPAEKILERAKEDNVAYDKWYEDGYLRASGTNKVDYKDIVAWFKEIQWDYDIYVYKIGYDQWSATYLVKDLENEFGKNACEVVRQGAQTLSGPMKSLGADFRSKRIIYDNNPITLWNLNNVSGEWDKNNNVRPIKYNTKRRIDGYMSILDAYTVLERYIDDYSNII